MDAQDFKNLGLSLAVALILVAFSNIAGELLIRPTPMTMPMTMPMMAEQAPSEPAKMAAPEPEPQQAAAPVTEPVTEPAPAQDDIAARLAAADPASGEKVFRLCKSCHTANKGGKNRVGPNLWEVVGRKKVSLEGFTYSDAFHRLEGVWTYKDLDTFLKNPRTFVVGTRMSIKGIKDPDQRAGLIAYLRSLSDNPQPLP
ncbi:MAG: cytochrome c family protein [Rhodospirillaceae bacterium]|nr:cytochrome c family protein [Rhodospirillaceae bacterium]